MTAMPRVLRYGSVVMAAVLLSMAAPAGAVLAAASTQSPAIVVAGVEPSQGQVVGVGMPVTVRFAKPITDRAAAEQSIHITAPVDTPGRFHWLNDNAVQWLPDGRWPAHSDIQVLAGGFSTRFETGAAVL